VRAFDDRSDQIDGSAHPLQVLAVQNDAVVSAEFARGTGDRRR
jgi:hypothetical protein